MTSVSYTTLLSLASQRLLVVDTVYNTERGSFVATSTYQFSVQQPITESTLTLIAGTNMTITRLPGTNTYTFASSGGGGGISDGNYGDITVSAGATVWTVNNDTVTNAKSANMATQTIKGRNTAGTGDPEDLSAATVKTILSLGNVENTALSTWAGSANIVTLGTISTGTWSATAIADGKIASALTGKTYNGVTLTTGGSATQYLNGVGSYVSITSVSGNAGTATALQTARSVGGVSFDGTADITPINIQAANEATDTTCFPAFFTSATGNLQPKTNTGLTFNSNTGALGATSFVGPLTGNVTGNVSGSAATLTTSRNIQGVAFNGSANIDILNGTGFVKVSGTTVSYDNSTYLTTSTAASTYQPLDSDLTTIAGLTATTDNFIVSVASAWASRTPAQVKTTLSLNNVENTALSTWAGTANITILGTIATGTWNATAIADGKIASALTGKTYNGVTLTTAGSATKYLNEAGNYVTITAGTGDMLGPASAVSGNVVIFSGVTGKLTSDSGLTLAGTNTGDQTITLTGPVTGSGTGSFATTITNKAVTLAKMDDVATGTIFYRKTAATGVPEVQTLATLKTDLGLTGTNSGDQTTVSGNAGTATALQTARNIGGTSFNGTADITPLNTTIANEATDTTCFPCFVTAATGDLQQKTNAALTFNSNTGSLSATTFVGALTGIASGNLPNNGGTLTGTLQLAQGTITLAPIKLVAGTNLTTPVAGVLEFDGTNLYLSI